MLSANINPASGGGDGGGDGMVLGGAMASMSATSAAADASVDDPSKKIRKPYKLTKSRESWSDYEHDKFVEAFQLFDRDWKKIEAFVSSKTVIQIRSHAQKYFSKVQKNGTSEHIPPPRPKRKATHPYPQKPSKDVPIPSQPATPFHASPFLDRGYSPLTSMPQTVSSWTHTSNNPSSTNLINEIPTNNYRGPDIPSSPNGYPSFETLGHAESHSGIYGTLQNITVPLPSQPVIPFHASFLEQGHAPLISMPEKGSSWTNTSNKPSSGNVTKENMMNNCSGADSCPSPNAYLVAERSNIGNHAELHSGMSDLAEVYGFFGSIFDQNRTDQLETLNDMNPVDAETVLLLMRNLSLNLTSPEFEDHRMLLASYNLEDGGVNPMNTRQDCEADPFVFRISAE